MSITRISFAPQVRISPKPSTPVQLQFVNSPRNLVQLGAHIPVLVSMPSALKVDGGVVKPRLVFGHIDTGATHTCIDVALANDIGLPQIGFSQSFTASGKQRTPTFVADLTLPTFDQKLYKNMSICSCSLPYRPGEEPSPQNFGILIGRDLLADWVLIWDGARSLVTISC